MESLPVIFRADKSGDFKGEVTAIFPTIPADNRGNLTCYAHIGQHGGASLDWYRTTRPATETESADLLKELRAIYEARPAADPATYGEPVRLDIRRRITPAMNAARVEALK